MLLRNLSIISCGHSFRGRIEEDENSDIQVLQAKDLDEMQSVNWHQLTKVSLTGRQSANFLQPNDILFMARGQKNFSFLLDLDVQSINLVAAQYFYIIRANNSEVFPEYLAWFLNQSSSQRYFLSKAEGSVTTSIRKQILEDTPIVVPDLKTQRTVVQLDNTIKKEKKLMKRMIENNEFLMQTIINKMNLINTVQKDI